MGRKRKKVGLALGGGGARGITHVGIIKGLVEQNIPIDFIAGTSAGAVAGAFYASGIPVDKMVEISEKLRWKNFARFKLSRRGMFSSKPIEELIEEHVGKKTFKDLKIPFVALATDILKGEGVWLNHPNMLLSHAVRASSSFPGVFQPYQIGHHYYCDGGASFNLPCRIVRQMGADIVIGIDVIPKVQIHMLPRHIPTLIDRGLDCLLHSTTQYTYPEGDYILNPIKERINSFNVKRAAYLIQLGIKCVEEHSEKIKELLT